MGSKLLLIALLAAGACWCRVLAARELMDLPQVLPNTGVTWVPVAADGSCSTACSDKGLKKVNGGTDAALCAANSAAGMKRKDGCYVADDTEDMCAPYTEDFLCGCVPTKGVKPKWTSPWACLFPVTVPDTDNKLCRTTVNVDDEEVAFMGTAPTFVGVSEWCTVPVTSAVDDDCSDWYMEYEVLCTVVEDD